MIMKLEVLFMLRFMVGVPVGRYNEGVTVKSSAGSVVSKGNYDEKNVCFDDFGYNFVCFDFLAQRLQPAG
jgi:hypothetical protein